MTICLYGLSIDFQMWNWIGQRVEKEFRILRLDKRMITDHWRKFYSFQNTKPESTTRNNIIALLKNVLLLILTRGGRNTGHLIEIYGESWQITQEIISLPFEGIIIKQLNFQTIIIITKICISVILRYI